MSKAVLNLFWDSIALDGGKATKATRGSAVEGDQRQNMPPPPPPTTRPAVAVVGAGLAGLACAWRLARSGVVATPVVLYDRGRAPGGRAARRRGDDGDGNVQPPGSARHDAGLSHIEPRSPAFVALLREWEGSLGGASGSGSPVSRWEGGGRERWVGRPSAAAIATAIAASDGVRLLPGAAVAGLDGGPGRWTVRLDGDGGDAALADPAPPASVVVLADPALAPAAAAAGSTAVAAALAAAGEGRAPLFAVFLALSKGGTPGSAVASSPSSEPPSVVRIPPGRDETLLRLVREGDKPGRSPTDPAESGGCGFESVERWTAVTTSGFARAALGEGWGEREGGKGEGAAFRPAPSAADVLAAVARGAADSAVAALAGDPAAPVLFRLAAPPVAVRWGAGLPSPPRGGGRRGGGEGGGAAGPGEDDGGPVFDSAAGLGACGDGLWPIPVDADSADPLVDPAADADEWTLLATGAERACLSGDALGRRVAASLAGAASRPPPAPRL